MNVIAVWTERVFLFLANVGLNIGFISSDEEHAIAGGGIIAVLTVVQIVLAVVTHKKSLPIKV